MRTLLLLAIAASTLANASGGYFRHPAISGDTIVFSAEGDLWKVPVTGGDAQRLTTHAGLEIHPAISPDGKWVAFTGSYDGPLEAYVMPLAGGVPKRLTWFGDRAEVVGWKNEGEVLVTSRYFHGIRKQRLASVSVATGVHRVVPLEEAVTAAALADGSLVFTNGDRGGDNARNYRGGSTTTLWRYREGAEATPITKPEANSSHPMRWKDRLAFAADRDGVTNVWSTTLDGQDPRQHTRHADFEVRGPSISGDRVAYQHGADIRVVDLATGQDRVVPIRLVSDFEHQRERWARRPLERFTSARISANGDRVAIVARGAVATAGVGNLRRVDIALPAGTRARTAELMPDGKNVLVIADTSGETELWLYPADGSGPGRQLTREADATRQAASVSPDGKWIAWFDRRRRLGLVEVASGKNRFLELPADAFPTTHMDWAPDSSAVAIDTGVGASRMPQSMLFRVSDGKRFTIASSRYPSSGATFSPDGKWLWFLAQRNFEPLVGHPWGDRNMGPYFDRRTKIYALSLQPGNRFPFQPRDELEPPKPEPATADPAKPGPVRVEPPRLEPPRNDPAKTAPAKSEPARPAPMDPTKPNGGFDDGQAPAASAPGDAPAASPGEPPRPVQRPRVPAIAWDGLERRLYEAPLPPGNYTAVASDGKRLWFLEEETTVERKSTLKSIAIDNQGAPVDTFAADVREFQVSNDGKKLFFRKWVTAPAAGDMYIVDPTPRAPEALPRFQVRLADWQFPVSPREEWAGIFADSWRMHRDWFYDTTMHRVDWPAMRRKYGALLPRVTDRDELSDLLAQMSAELSLLHSQVGAGDLRRGEPNILPATLGAEYEKVADGLRIARLYRADPELVSDLPPLSRTEVGAKEGDVITAIDGRRIREIADLFAALRDRAGKQVLVELKGPAGGARKAIAIPADANREIEYKRRDYEWRKRERLETASKGRFGYLYLRAMGPQDLASFTREFYPAVGREGLVIDVRGNQGGSIDSIVIEKLMRRAWAYWRTNTGTVFSNMQGAFRGPIVVLIDEDTYSDGETFAEGIRRLGLGTLVGKRTAGAGVWLSDSNRQLDGGIARAAELGQFAPEGVWLIEGKGVQPDVEVENPPHATFKGEDAQLAAAIRIIEEKLAANPVTPPKVPAYPATSR